MEICLVAKRSSPVVDFAAQELIRYLGQADPSLSFSRLSGEGAPTERAFVLEYRDEAPDTWDEIDVSLRRNEGHVWGSNPRSVLLGVYELLKKLGFVFAFPGAQGTFVPALELAQTAPVAFRHKASCRHRGFCIEGAFNYQHVTEVIDWLPKLGFNEFFTQFFTPFVFFDRWYSSPHRNEPELSPLSEARVDGMVREYEKELKKRGLLHHRIGHGWLCAPLGLPSGSWAEYHHPLPESAQEMLALVDGQRALFEHSPLKTSLCFSHPAVRRLVVDAVVTYCLSHREADYVHFWLSDGFNNECTCENCVERPADYYVQMLNEIDDRLTAAQCKTKIVFLLYFNLLWAPVQRSLHRSDRFVLMFAPISRSYSASYCSGQEDPLPACLPFVRNRLHLPKTIGENLAFLRDWQRTVGPTDSFDFDYHLMWDHFWDFSYKAFAKVLYGDIHGLADLGLNGLFSCQVLHTSFPNAFGMYVMGSALWDSSTPLFALETTYFRAVYGRSGDWCARYLDEISRLFDLRILRGERPLRCPQTADQCARLVQYLDANSDALQACATESPLRRTAWRLLYMHNRLIRKLAPVVGAFAVGEDERAWAQWEQVKAFLQEIEPETQAFLDVYQYIDTYENRFRELADPAQP